MGRHQMNILHLSKDERKFLEKFTKSGSGRAREVQRAKSYYLLVLMVLLRCKIRKLQSIWGAL